MCSSNHIPNISGQTGRRRNLVCLALCLCYFLIGGTNVYAQPKAKFSIASFEPDPFDLTAQNPEFERTDGSGDRYSIIKVTSNNPDDDLTQFNFNFGNMKHEVEPHDGELWLYVQRNAKYVTITRNGYAPINRYDLHHTIESGKTYVMRLTTEGKRVFYQMVQFTVSPKDANATITIKSSKAGAMEEFFGTTDKDGIAEKSLEYGTYTYSVLAENYHKQDGRFTLSNKTQTHKEPVTLRANFALITLKVNPAADIYVDGERKAYSEWTGELKSGSHHIECQRWGYKTSSQYISVTEGIDETIELKSPEPILGTVAITSTPSGAEIKIDGKNYGITPKNIDLPIGDHKISLQKDGYNSPAQTVLVKQDQNSNVHITLSRKASVKFNWTPDLVNLYIDGTYKDGISTYTLDTEIGRTHRIELRDDRNKYTSVRKNIYIDGKNTEYTYNLKKRYTRKTDFYIALGFGAGHSFNCSATLGCHISNFNIEASFEYCFSDVETIYWYGFNEITNDIYYDGSIDYKPSLILSMKAGYGINASSRFKFTPQIGYRYTDLSGWDYDTYCASGTIGVRAYVAFASHFGLSLTPEYAFPLAKGDYFKILSDVSPKIRNLASGFNANLSFVISF